MIYSAGPGAIFFYAEAKAATKVPIWKGLQQKMELHKVKDKLQTAGQNLDWLIDTRSGCLNAIHGLCYLEKQTNLKLESLQWFRMVRSGVSHQNDNLCLGWTVFYGRKRTKEKYPYNSRLPRH